MRLAGVRIGAADLAAATGAYGTLLEVGGVPLPGGGTRFRLGRGSVDVVSGQPGLLAVRFVTEATGPDLPDTHGVRVVLEPDDGPPAEAPDPVAIDHVVVQTARPERAIALWRDRLGLRLALDREFPARGLRLLFFRSGGITLEYAAPLAPGAGEEPGDRLYGVSYRVVDLAARCERLRGAGIDVSAPRPGMRPGTTVATVRSGTCGVPTLLLQVEPPGQ
jgi:catechol 2,3-dioxygenase-like lactoylglutathione lyase family enzyme